MRAIPTAVTTLVSESVVSAGGQEGGGRRHVTVSNFVRVAERLVCCVVHCLQSL